jgi:hypothetical protein
LMNYRLSQNAGNLLTTWATISFSRWCLCSIELWLKSSKMSGSTRLDFYFGRVCLLKCDTCHAIHVSLPRDRVLIGNLWCRFQFYFPVRLYFLIFTSHSVNLKRMAIKDFFLFSCAYSVFHLATVVKRVRQN